MKRGQMEMIGLVIIVILITLGMLFMAIFALKEDPQKKIFTRKGLAYSTVSAAMKMNIECKDEGGKVYPQLGKDVLDQCAQDNADSYCIKYNCEGKHCCQVFNETINKMLNSTLGDWGKRFEFRAQLVQGKGLKPITLSEIKSKDGCQGKERDSSGLFPIQAGSAGLVETVLYICD